MSVHKVSSMTVTLSSLHFLDFLYVLEQGILENVGVILIFWKNIEKIRMRRQV